MERKRRTDREKCPLVVVLASSSFSVIQFCCQITEKNEIEAKMTTFRHIWKNYFKICSFFACSFSSSSVSKPQKNKKSQKYHFQACWIALFLKQACFFGPLAALFYIIDGEELKSQNNDLSALIFKSHLLQKLENFRIPFTRDRVKLTKRWYLHGP